MLIRGRREVVQKFRRFSRLATGGGTWLFASLALAENGGADGAPLTAGGLGAGELDPASIAGALALIVAAVLAFYGARART